MSYDLVFWRQDHAATAAPEAIYSSLLRGERVDGILDLRVEEFLSAILGTFSGSVREPNGSEDWVVWVASDEQAMFEVQWSPQHVLVCCRGTSNDTMNDLIDIAVAHGCRLYDPQVNERFG
ncbi:MAG TPA: hypothetical protein VIJ51_06200 [Solirubrobacteraceae bacterium]